MRGIRGVELGRRATAGRCWGEPGRSSRTGIRGDGGNRGGPWERGCWSQEGTWEIQGGTWDSSGAGRELENPGRTRREHGG